MSSSHAPTITTPEFDRYHQRFAPIFEQIAQGASQREVNRELPYEWINALNESGFGKLRVPAAYGGDDVSVRTFIQLLTELAAADSNIAHQYRSHAGFVESLRLSDPSHGRYWFPKIIQGATIGNASTEIGGNALGTLNTQLHRQRDAEGNITGRLNGKKYYATGSLFSSHTRVSATFFDENGVPDEGRGFAVVGIHDDGVELLDDWDGFGQRLTATGTAIFNDVVVEEQALIPRTPGSVEAQHEATFFQLVLLAVCVGIGKAALRDATELIRRRKRTFNTGLGLPFAQNPLIQRVTGEISSQVFTAEATLLHTAAIVDQGLEALAETQSINRLATAEIAVQQAQVTIPQTITKVCSDIFLTGGASNTSGTKNLDRHWRNAQTVATHNPIEFRARAIGDWRINGVLPEGLNAIGNAHTTATADNQQVGANA